MKYDLENKLAEAKDIVSLQGTDGNWDANSYMHGLYNGMEMILAIFEEREPIFRSLSKFATEAMESEADLPMLINDLGLLR
ncbi:MAG: hypothetical protein H0X02_08305 [Nitrosomonas sp.]|nr:hypothetical protein [Nitrosomonas sp.]